MGAFESTTPQEEDLISFRRLSEFGDNDGVEIPRRAENRVPTDKNFLIAFGVLIIILVPFLAYTIAYSDVNRNLGYDDCGNICGKKNIKYDQWNCTGQDFTEKRSFKEEDGKSYCYSKFDLNDTFVLPELKGYTSSIDTNLTSHLALKGFNSSIDTNLTSYLALKGFNSSIDRNLTSYTALKDVNSWTDTNLTSYHSLNDFNSSIDNLTSSLDDLQHITHAITFHGIAWKLTVASLSPLGAALIVFFLLRVAPVVTIWTVISMITLLWSILAGYVWFLYSRSDDDKNPYALLFLSIVLTFFLAIFILVIACLRKKIIMVTVLFKEATKATLSMPQLLTLPVVLFIGRILILAAVATTTHHVMTAGFLSPVGENKLKYVPNFAMKFTMSFNILMSVWAFKFITGIQQMIIAGAVAQWYFTRSKGNLDRPFRTSARVTFKFHLGTVAFGSLVITIVWIIRKVIRTFTRWNCIRQVLGCLVSTIERLLDYLTDNAYILTAMHGEPFYKSGKRAATMLYKSFLNTVTHSAIARFILFMVKLLVMVIALVITVMFSEFNIFIFLLMACIAFIVAATCFAIYETVIDTIFLCFLEDTHLNDGVAKPYAMSKELMLFTEEFKKVSERT